MQKKLIALAVTAAISAPAFADVTVYGIADAGITSTTKTGFKSRMDLTSGGLSTSRIGVKASEDLGDGMKAIAVVEYKMDIANSDMLGSTRQEMVGLAGGFGTVVGGYLQTAGYDFSGKFNPFAGSAVDPYSSANVTSFITTGSRASNAVAYISPNMGGLTVAYNHSFNAGSVGLTADGSTTTNPTTANLLSATFNQGPLAVGVVYVGTADDDTNYEKLTEMGLGASYDLGMVKLLGAYLTHKKDANAANLALDSAAAGTNKMVSFSAVAPVGPGAVVFGLAKNTKSSTTVDDNTTALSGAYLYNLSKATTAYVAGTQVTTKAGTSPDVKTTVLAVGVRNKF